MRLQTLLPHSVLLPPASPCCSPSQPVFRGGIQPTSSLLLLYCSRRNKQQPRRIPSAGGIIFALRWEQHPEVYLCRSLPWSWLHSALPAQGTVVMGQKMGHSCLQLCGTVGESERRKELVTEMAVPAGWKGKWSIFLVARQKRKVGTQCLPALPHGSGGGGTMHTAWRWA